MKITVGLSLSIGENDVMVNKELDRNTSHNMLGWTFRRLVSQLHPLYLFEKPRKAVEIKIIWRLTALNVKMFRQLGKHDASGKSIHALTLFALLY